MTNETCDFVAFDFQGDDGAADSAACCSATVSALQQRPVHNQSRQKFITKQQPPRHEITQTLQIRSAHEEGGRERYRLKQVSLLLLALFSLDTHTEV